MFYYWCFFPFFHCEIFEPIDVKLYHVIGSVSSFIIQVPKFGGPPPKKIWGQKRSKFRAISDHIRHRPRIYPERTDIYVSKIGKLVPTSIPTALGKSEKQVINYNPCHVGPKIGPKIYLQKVIGVHVDPPKINTAVLCKIMQHCVGDSWRCYERNWNPLNCLPSGTYGTGRPHVGLCPKFLVYREMHFPRNICQTN